MKIQHICKNRYQSKLSPKQEDDWMYENNYYGEAFDEMIFDPVAKVWYLTNGEYCTITQFCPWCGVNVVNIKV